MSKFYLCTEAGCNKKYKTFTKFESHLLAVHSKIADSTIIPVEITKDNRKTVENARDSKVKKEEQAKKKAEILRQAALEEEAKRVADEATAERYMALELEKVRLIEETVKMQALYLQRIKDSEECCMCLAAPRDAIVTPCGHKYFCFDCITNYRSADPQKGCPMCRSDIILISRVYE